LIDDGDDAIRTEFETADVDKDGKLNKSEFVEAGKHNPQLSRYALERELLITRRNSSLSICAIIGYL
jgi:hypothetical protein